MGLKDNKPILVMIFLQFMYASVTLSSRAALVQEMSPRVFVAYRQAIATLLIAPIALITRSRKKTRGCQMGWRTFLLIFLASLIGVTLNQNMYFEGLYLASSSMASAMGNLLPALTFLMAYFAGFEKVHIRRFRSIAKVLGTAICVAGAVAMAMIKGPKLLNMVLTRKNSLFTTGNDMWLLGCLLLFGSSCSWSLWLILQVPISDRFPDHLSVTALMCFLGASQSALVTFFMEPDMNGWRLHSHLELICCVYAALGSVISFFGQAWCISKKGPLFSAMFNPLNTVIVTIIASIVQHEKMYLGGLLGGLAVIFGLYIVLWGKAKDLEESNEEIKQEKPIHKTTLIKESPNMMGCNIDLEQPLLLNESTKGLPYNAIE